MGTFIMEYWVEFAFTAIIAILSGVVRYMYTSFRAMKLGMQAILRNDIIDVYNKCVSREPRAYIKLYEISNVEAMYTQYHSLGGNGTITALYEDLLALPTEKEVIHKSNDQK